MGQASTFILHKQGSFQLWNEVWDSKKSFEKINVEHSFLKICFSIFFKNKNFLNWKLLNISKFFFWKNKFNLYFNNKRFLEKYLISTKKIKKNKAFVGHLDIFRLQGWLIINLFFFLTNKNIKIKKKFKKNKKLYNFLFFEKQFELKKNLNFNHIF